MPPPGGIASWAGLRELGRGGCGQGGSPPGAPGLVPPPSPSRRPEPGSGDLRGGSAEEELALLTDRRGMSSGGSRQVTRRRSSSSPGRGSDFQPPPWEQRRAPLAREEGGAEAEVAAWVWAWEGRCRDWGASWQVSPLSSLPQEPS